MAEERGEGPEEAATEEEGEGRRRCLHGGKEGDLTELVAVEFIARAYRREGEARLKTLRSLPPWRSSPELVTIVVEARWETSHSLFDFFIATEFTVYVASSANYLLRRVLFLIVME